MLRAGGYAVLVDPDSAQPQEWDTFTCAHCQFIVNVRPFQGASDAGGHCKICDKNICSACVDRRECRPLAKWLEEIERRGEAMARSDAFMRALR